MQQQTSSLQTVDGLKLFSQCWLPDGLINASVIISHGYAEHSGRYQALAEFLLDAGYAVYALDYRGHGKSEGERANVNVFRDYVQDLNSYIESLHVHTAATPRFLLGHSMGAAIATQFVLEHPHKVDGLLLSGAFLKNATKVPALLLQVSGLASRFLPSLPTTKLDTRLISRDKAVVDAYVADPLIYHGGTKARLGAELLAAGPYILERAEGLNLPLLIMHGSADQIADQEGSRELFKRASSKDKQFKLYQGFYHEIFNELSREEVFQEVVNWLKSHV